MLSRLSPMLDTIATPPEGPADVPSKGSRVWRLVLFVVAVQALLIAFGTLAFAALGFANEGPTCGGG